MKAAFALRSAATIPITYGSNILPTTNLLRRWRADSIGQADGTSVATWPNLAGGVDLIQATSGSQPTYALNRQNGRPAVVWPNTGGSTYLANTTFAALSQPVTVVAVCKPFDTANIELFHGGGIEVYIQSTKWGTWSNSSLVGATPTAGQWVVVVATFNAGSGSSIYVNGTSQVTGSSGNGTLSATMNVGRHPSSGQNWHGDIGEIMVYNATLSASQIAAVDSYVQDWWGIPVADYVGRASAPPYPSSSLYPSSVVYPSNP